MGIRYGYYKEKFHTIFLNLMSASVLVANTIGYQSKSNSTYIEKFIRKDQPKTELLHNWLTRKDRIKKSALSQ